MKHTEMFAVNLCRSSQISGTESHCCQFVSCRYIFAIVVAFCPC
uniref:Uncharacterized protein n=1 Tax=Anguilla anguilla TaxID=7936 RepID=A0A0E9SFI0_ANGAN